MLADAPGLQHQLVVSHGQIAWDVEARLAPKRAIDVRVRGIIGILVDLAGASFLQLNVYVGSIARMHVDHETALLALGCDNAVG